MQWFYETAVILHELLHETGSLYVHLDWHIAHYAKLILDELCGKENFRNEIIWKRKGGSANPLNRLGTVTDTIFWYSKSEEPLFHPQLDKDSDNVKAYIKERFVYVDANGKKFRRSPLISPNPRPNLIYDYKGYKPPPNGWAISIGKMKEWEAEGRLYFPPDKSQRIERKIYLDDYQGQPIQNLWTDVFVVNPVAEERVSYDTQKPEALLERVISMSSDEGSLVLDCFGGSGTTAVVAEKLRRRWITCDLGRFAIHTTRKRLLSIPGVRPFVVQNLGKYERQLWAGTEFGEGKGKQAAARQRAYVEFILKLAQAQPLNGYTWIKALKGGAWFTLAQWMPQ